MTTLSTDRPVPLPDLDSAPHFEAAAEGRLSVPRCDDCGAFHWFPSRQCPKCHGWNVSWPTLSGRAELYSYTVVGHPLLPFLFDKAPYVIGLVELPDAPGVRLIADMPDVAPTEVRIGMPLQANFETLADGVGLVHFGPA